MDQTPELCNHCKGIPYHERLQDVPYNGHLLYTHTPRLPPSTTHACFGWSLNCSSVDPLHPVRANRSPEPISADGGVSAKRCHRLRAPSGDSTGESGASAQVGDPSRVVVPICRRGYSKAKIFIIIPFGVQDTVQIEIRNVTFPWLCPRGDPMGDRSTLKHLAKYTPLLKLLISPNSRAIVSLSHNTLLDRLKSLLEC